MLLLVLLVFNGETWPTITPCTVMGEDDMLVSDTATCSSAITHHVSSYASHVITEIASPKYPESKDRISKSFRLSLVHGFSGLPYDTVCICLVIIQLG